ncbi:hypothetical protein ABW20_dc0108865 [Dactylellina cionopaga]|nr:hypothetical protein ABW20_dc0108865 [Dactylellina cionopaga]
MDVHLLEVDVDDTESQKAVEKAASKFTTTIDRPLPDDQTKKFAPTNLDLNEQLLLQTNDSVRGGCHNKFLRDHPWISIIIYDILSMRDATWPMLNHMASICKVAEIYTCTNIRCIENRERLREILPLCDWPPFREWFIQIAACQRSLTPSERLELPFFHLSAALNSFYWFLTSANFNQDIAISGDYINLEGRTNSIDLFPISEIIYWGLTYQTYLGNYSLGREPWGVDMLPHAVTSPAVVAATEKTVEIGLCLNRLWNIALISDRREHDLPAIVSLAEQYPQLRQPGHESCTAGLCEYSTIDTTRITQLHKCYNVYNPNITKCPAHEGQSPTTNVKGAGSIDINNLYFDPEFLKGFIEEGGNTVWSVHEPYEVMEGKPYIAISHVWSDGTGVGLKPPGYVNPCLFTYFASLARDLDCQAVWWDTISIPTDPELRRKAINQMHNYYRYAKCTLLHDRYLTDFEWVDDGSPCIAVILSPWFTRGWTALECILSKSVKVVFKKRGKDEWIIKDLDEDILAKDPSECSRGHWMATKILRRLRKGIDNVSDLLAILKPRHTAWPRDRMIIAALLAGVEIGTDMRPATITKDIIKKIGKISVASLLHCEATIVSSGGWSWCPSYLYDMPASPPSEFNRALLFPTSVCYVDNQGTIKGYFSARRVLREDVLYQRITPMSSNPAVILKIKTALVDWKDCLLLGQFPGPYILVTTEGKNESFSSHPIALSFFAHLLCKYVGSVHRVGDKASMNPDRGIPINVIIGREPDGYLNIETKNTLPLIDYRDLQVENGFLGSHIWVGDRPQGDLLVPRLIKQNGSDKTTAKIAMHSLQLQHSSGDESPVTVTAEPCFIISQDGTITNVSTAWSSEIPTYARVDSTLAWPPMPIPSNERTISNYVGLGNNMINSPYMSKKLFRLEFISNTFTYAAIQDELLAASGKYPYSGIWICFNSKSDKYEFHLFHQPNMDELISVKLTSIDPQVPRGHVSFHIKSGLQYQSAESVVEAQNQASVWQTGLRYVLQNLGWGQQSSSADAQDDRFCTVNGEVCDLVNRGGLHWETQEFAFFGDDAIIRALIDKGVIWKYRRVPNKLLFPGK